MNNHIWHEQVYFALIHESYIGKPAITIHCKKSDLTPALESRIREMAEELLAEFQKVEEEK